MLSCSFIKDDLINNIFELLPNHTLYKFMLNVNMEN